MASSSLLPREHGAYFQLGLPLVTALLVTGGSASAFWLSAAAVVALLAHEPLLVLLGHRGARLAERDGSRALRWGVGLGTLGALCLGMGLLALPTSARPFLALPLILGAEVLLLVWSRQERTLSGEVLAALALSAWAVPVALGGGMEVAPALTLWGTYGLCFGLATLAVRTVIASHRPRAPREKLRWGTGVTVAGMLLAAGAWALVSGLPLSQVAAPWPMGLVSLGLCVGLPSPRRLHALGWSLGASGTLTAVLLVLGGAG
jgi:hypothetical protein